MSKNLLFQDFPDVSKDTWKDKIITDLKGADYQKKLVWRTDEGFEVQPFYTREDLSGLASDISDPGKPATSLATDNDWLIRQDFMAGSSPEECNSRIRQAIERGTRSVGLNLSGLDTPGKGYLEKLLAGVDTTLVSFNFKNAAFPEKLYSTLVEYLNSPGNTNNTIRGSLGFDPLGDFAQTGSMEPDAFDRLTTLVREAAKVFPDFRIITVDAGLFQDSGSTLSQELGFGLAAANTYIDELTNRGLDAATIIDSMKFSFAVGPDYFMEIAKLRAARNLWQVMYAEWNAGTGNPSMLIHTRTASWNLTVYDPNVNLLRTTTETMSASLGGSDEITVLPFDFWFKEDNEFSSRIARNMQIILKEEAWLNNVADPAAGSYYIEQLTSDIMDQAWKYFLDTEKQSGYLDAFRNGSIQEQIEESANRKREKAASRRTTILGVNQYPAFSELILNQERHIPDLTHENTAPTQPLLPFRIAGEIESLRVKTEKSGKQPSVFLLKYGDPAWRSARAMFAGNFFACAGFMIIDSDGFDDLQKGIEAAKKSRADIVVVCSDDEAYATAGPETYKSLHSSAEIVIAGYPKDAVENLKEIGIKHFIHVKSNLLEELKKFQELILY